MGSQVNDVEMDRIGELAADESDRLDRWNMVFCTALEMLLGIACRAAMESGSAEHATDASIIAQDAAQEIADNTWGKR